MVQVMMTMWQCSLARLWLDGAFWVGAGWLDVPHGWLDASTVVITDNHQFFLLNIGSFIGSYIIFLLIAEPTLQFCGWVR